jgi:hypothetical protein
VYQHAGRAWITHPREDGMTMTPIPPLEDYRVAAARQALAEMPLIADIERPYFWLGRLKAVLHGLIDGWPSGVPAGMDAGQRQVLGQALADAMEYRAPEGACTECDVSPGGLCCDHAADLDLTDAYLDLARELAVAVPR